MGIDRVTGARSHIVAGAAATALALVLSACGQENRYVAPPPPKVTVAVPVKQKVTRYLEATGYSSAINTTNLVARVQGFLQKINYKDGDQVKEGAILFIIEPEPYKLVAPADALGHETTFMHKCCPKSLAFLASNSDIR